MTANEFYGPELAQMRLAERQVLEAVEELQRVWKAQGRQSPVLYTSSRIKSPESMCRKLAQRGQPQTRQAADCATLSIWYGCICSPRKTTTQNREHLCIGCRPIKK